MLLTFSSEKKTCSCYMYRSLSLSFQCLIWRIWMYLFFFFFVKHKNFTFKYKWVHNWGIFVFFCFGEMNRIFFFPQLFFVFLINTWGNCTSPSLTPSCSFAQYTVFKNGWGGGGEAVMEDTQAKVTISLHQRCETQLEYRNHRGRRTFGTTCPYYIHKLFQLFKVFRVFALHHLWEFKRTITSWEWCGFYWKCIYIK